MPEIPLRGRRRAYPHARGLGRRARRAVLRAGERAAAVLDPTPSSLSRGRNNHLQPVFSFIVTLLGLFYWIYGRMDQIQNLGLLENGKRRLRLLTPNANEAMAWLSCMV